MYQSKKRRREVIKIMQKGFKQVNLEGCVSGTLAVPVIGENGNWFIGNDDTGVYAKGNGSGGNGTHYSTEEQVIGTWIDGSVLYRKTIDFGALPNATLKSVEHGITNIGLMVNFSATAKNTSGVQIDLPYTSPNAVGSGISTQVDATNIVLNTNANHAAYSTCYITLEYTKVSESV